MKNSSMRLFSFVTFSLLSAILISCDSQTEVSFEQPRGERFKSDYHFTPPSGWMNDPNGLVYLDGKYHLFYQHYPEATVWGPMHWGHAVSTDLLTWEHLPIALYPDSLGYIFSGSAVVDQDNTSGLGSPEKPPLVAIYTYHDMEGEQSGSLTYQTQGIAFSLDKGRTWEKYTGNPVLDNPGIKDFRDPKVTQINNADGSKYWIMTLAVLDQIHFYSSENLIEWKLVSEFGKNIGAHGGVWECPDLLPFTTPDGVKKWVLLVSINPGGPQGGSATQYFIGDFANGQFIPDDTMLRWIDYGPDNYAGVTWSNLPDEQNRTAFIGWMSNWLYAQVTPTESFRSALTIPRELSLFDVEGTLLLKSAPAKELETLRKTAIPFEKTSKLPSQSFELVGTIETDNFRISFTNESGDEVIVTKKDNLVGLDRRKAGISDFHPDFANAHLAPMSWEAENLRIFVDANSIELFLNDGELVMTSLIFPNSPLQDVTVSPGLDDLTIYPLSEVMKSSSQKD